MYFLARIRINEVSGSSILAGMARLWQLAAETDVYELKGASGPIPFAADRVRLLSCAGGWIMRPSTPVATYTNR